MLQERIQKLYQEAGVDLKASRELFAKSDATAEDLQQAERLMDSFEQKNAQAKRMEEVETKSAAFGEFMNKVDETKRLPQIQHQAVAGTGNGGQTEAEIKSAFRAFLTTGESRELKAAMVEGTNNQGGYLVPTVYTDELTRALYDDSIMRKAGARIIPLSTENTSMATLTASGAAVLTSENAAFDEKEPSVGQVTFTPYKYTRLSKASDELVADSRFDLWSIILKPDFSQAFAQTENTVFTTGSGSGQPEGILLNATTGVTLANSTTQVSNITSADSLLDLVYQLDYKYRPKAKFMMNDVTVKIVRKFKTTTNEYLFQPSLQAGQPDTLLGYPLLTNPGMPVPAASAKSIAFGDFSYFWIGDRQDLVIKVLTELYSGTGQIGYRAFKRIDSHLMLSAAVVTLVQAAS